MQGNYTQALSWLERAHFAFEHTNNQDGLGKVLHLSGRVAAQQGQLEVAQPLFEESLAVRRELGDRVGETEMLNNLAVIASHRGEYEKSRDLQEEALAINREIGDPRLIARTLNNLGNQLRHIGDLAGARQRLEEAVALQREIGDRWLLANALNNLGNILRAEGNFDEARGMYAESMDIVDKLGDGWAAAYLLEDVARMFHLAGYDSNALVLISAANSLRDSIDAKLSPSDQAELDEIQGEIEIELGVEAARDCVESGKRMAMSDALAFALQSIKDERQPFRGRNTAGLSAN
jgi:tetratricopeptide (TPR) repeat protein